MGKKGKGQGKPKGRAAQRGKAQKSSPRAGGWQQKFQFVDDADDNPQRSFRGFSQSNARDPQQQMPNVKLRHQAISFVSAAPTGPAAEQEGEFVEEAIAVAAGNEGAMDDEQDSDYSEEFGEEALDSDEDSAIQTNIMTDNDVDISQMNIQSDTEITGLETDGMVDADTIAADLPSARPASPEAALFFVDTAGDSTLDPGVKAHGKRPVRAPSPAPSDSSEEVVVFHGRGRHPITVNDPVSQQSQPTSPPTTQTPLQTQPNNPPISQPTQTPHVTDGLLAALGVPASSARATPSPVATSSAKAVPSPAPAKGWANRPSTYQVEQQQASQTWQAAPSFPYWKKGKPRPDLDPTPSERAAEEAAPPRTSRVAFQEPEGETLDEVDLAATSSRLNLVEPENDTLDELDLALNGSRATRRGKRGRKKDNRQMRSVIDEEAAYDDYMENLKAQLELDGESGDIPALTPVNGAAAVEAGPSMVVDGREVPDAELLDKEDEWEDDDSSESEGPIGQDLSELSDEGACNYSDLENSSELEDELEYTEREQWEDEEDLRQRRIAGMDDEHLARLYAKQFELGIDSDELLIDDGMHDEGAGDLVEAIAGLRDMTNSSFGRSVNKHGMRRSRRNNGDCSFPDASALADTVEQYGENGFDIMDFERPSLRPRKKGRKGKLPPELEALSDDELREEMIDTWENDRSKKRLKKAEREELRQQGLLGATSKKGKADLSQKYLEGMTMQQVHEELRRFLQDDGQSSRPFPPMSKEDRKALHVVADKLNLKSKSVGSGKNRFPVLYKTSFTLEYSEAHFNKLMHASSRGFLTNSAHRGGKKAAKGSSGAFGGGAKSRPGRGGGFDKSATSLRNGEVVGAGAAEIGRESVGHKLMEKMGWSRGMALGKEGEGMLMPVQQMMRTGKAGLG